MMRETIYRDEAIKVVRHLAMEFTDADTRQKMIEAIPPADKPQEWIPCSSRLPEEEGEYLVTVKKYVFDSSYYDVQIAYCSPNKKWFHISNCEILAWKPRPKPWEEAEDDEGHDI